MTVASQRSGPILIALGDRVPVIAAGSFVAPTAVLVGEVVIEPGASVWFGAVLRADFNRIVIGPGSCVQDNAVLHCTTEQATLIGPNVAVGHLAMLEGCTVDEGALIGTASVIMRGSRIGHHAMVAAGSVVLENTQIPPGVLVAGVPAEVKKPLGGRSSEWVGKVAAEYQALRLRYLAGARVL
jgi:carbonic anhydrase/acetyltransferase-like protein (isoleucine patch superfamily)